MAQLIELARINQLLTAVKTYADTEVAKKQDANDNLTGLSALNTTGLVKRTGDNTYAAAALEDADVKNGEALWYAAEAFKTKDGTITTDKIVSSDNNTSIDMSGSKVVIKAPLDGNGKPGVVFEDAKGNETRIPTIDEVKSEIQTAVTSSSVYRGKFQFYAEGATLAEAEGKITTAVADQTALLYDTAAKKIYKGTYNGTDWTTEELIWGTGDWVWVEDLTTTTNLASGRVIIQVNEGAVTVDTIEDREGKPDEVGITYNSSGAYALKTTTNETEYGNTEVMAAITAANIGYGEGMTLKQKVQALDYTIATEADVQAVLDSIFGTGA